MVDEHTPLLLFDDRQAQRDASHDHVHNHIVWLLGEDSYAHTTRTKTQLFLSSKLGHYLVLLLVSLDVSCIFADFIISLYVCEHSGQKNPMSLASNNNLLTAQDALGIVSLVFSCLFMVELLACIWAFGLPYFKSRFHCFDAVVIIAGFIVDVCLKGVLEEVGSIVVVLRLWRVFKIIEELTAGAEEEMDAMKETIERLQHENEELKKEMTTLKSTSGLN